MTANETNVPAKLNERQRAKIAQLEEETGATIVALNAKPEAANLSQDQIAAIREAEVEMSLVLVAIDPHSAAVAGQVEK